MLFFARFAKCTDNVDILTASHTTMGRMRAVALDLVRSVRHLSISFFNLVPQSTSELKPTLGLRVLLFHKWCLARSAMLADPPLGVLFEWFVGLRRHLCLFNLIAAFGLFSFLTLLTVWSTSILTRRHITSSGFRSSPISCRTVLFMLFGFFFEIEFSATETAFKLFASLLHVNYPP